MSWVSEVLIYSLGMVSPSLDPRGVHAGDDSFGRSHAVALSNQFRQKGIELSERSIGTHDTVSVHRGFRGTRLSSPEVTHSTTNTSQSRNNRHLAQTQGIPDIQTSISVEQRNPSSKPVAPKSAACPSLNLKDHQHSTIGYRCFRFFFMFFSFEYFQMLCAFVVYLVFLLLSFHSIIQKILHTSQGENKRKQLEV